MEKLISNCFSNESVPESYVFPPELRPGTQAIPSCEAIPIVDLGSIDGGGRAEIIKQISKACQEYGFFQVINHGIPMKSTEEMMNVAKELFEMRREEKAKVNAEEPKHRLWIATSIDHNQKDIHLWRDNVKHYSYPVEDHMHLWPEKPTAYREVTRAYVVEIRGLALRLLELISEGLGLELGYFNNQLSKDQMMSINHYPPCPNPSLTLGLPKHSDPNLLTLLRQGDVSGLQVFKDGKWIAVEPIPNAFVVNVGSQLQIISNDRLRSVEHRAVTNSRVARTTIAIFLYPSMDCFIEPAPALVNEHNPPLYRAFKFQDFFKSYVAKMGDNEGILQQFKLQP